MRNTSSVNVEKRSWPNLNGETLSLDADFKCVITVRVNWSLAPPSGQCTETTRAAKCIYFFLISLKRY